MNGYVEAGYAAAIGTLGAYGGLLVLREKAARRRLPAPARVQADRRVAPEPAAERAARPPSRT